MNFILTPYCDLPMTIQWERNRHGSIINLTPRWLSNHWWALNFTFERKLPMPEEFIHKINVGGEILDIYDVMHRYRNDGSCDYIIERALRLLAKEQSELRSKKQE